MKQAETNLEEIASVCHARIERKCLSDDWKAAHARIEQELQFIKQKNAQDLFRLAFSIAELGKRDGLHVRVNGAAAGSTILFLLGLSPIDPIRHRLLAERYFEASKRFPLSLDVLVEPGNIEAVRKFLADQVRELQLIPEIQIVPMSFNEAVVEAISRSIRMQTGVCKLEMLSLDDEATWRAIGQGQTEGISNLDSDDAKLLCTEMRPRNLQSLAALLALASLSAVDPELAAEYQSAGHELESGPEVNDSLHETRGCILYQEQVMTLLNRLSGFSLADGFQCVKSFALRRSEEIHLIRKRYFEQTSKRGIPFHRSNHWLHRIASAARRVTCQNHKYASAMIGYRSAFFKTHFPSDFQAVVNRLGI